VLDQLVLTEFRQLVSSRSLSGRWLQVAGVQLLSGIFVPVVEFRSRNFTSNTNQFVEYVMMQWERIEIRLSDAVERPAIRIIDVDSPDRLVRVFDCQFRCCVQ
jgi:hypothetical protein